MIAIRWIVSMLLALLITLGLFYFMQALIATGAQIESNVTVVKMVDATMPDIEMEVVREIEKPSLSIQRAAVEIDTDLSIGGASISITDGEMLPLVNVTPTYPTRAASRGIEGWCQVSFTVTDTGGVRDVVVVDAEPAGIFDTSSIRAAEKFKFQPKVVDGKGVEVPNVQYIFRYELEGEQ